MVSHAVASPPMFDQAVRRMWRPGLLGIALVLGMLGRLTYGRDMPLWFDETFTGAIAGQDSVAGLWRWLRTELTGPFFYGTYWLWARVAGVSTEALRLPGLIFTLAAPLVVWRWGHRDPTMRLLWAAVLLLWLPMPVFAADARPYALLVLLGTVQVSAFCTVMRAPMRRHALWWALPTLAMGLTHYLALVPGLVQGLLLLAVHRGVALRLWPATLPFALLAGWMALHLSFVVQLGGGVVAMSTRMGAWDLARMPALIVGDHAIALLLALALGWVLVLQLHVRGVQRDWRPSAEGWAGIAGVVAFVTMFVVATVVPGMSVRYFIPVLPAMIFGLAWWLRTALRRAGIAVAAFFAVMIVASIGLAVSGLRDRSLDQRHAFGLDLPSRWLAERPPARVLFFWADPTAVLASEFKGNMAEVGGFFLRRAGARTRVDVMQVPVGRDAAAAVSARAASTPDTAILWIGNAPSADPHRQTAPLFSDRAWECRDFGAGRAVSVACRRR